jgi:glycosidase
MLIRLQIFVLLLLGSVITLDAQVITVSPAFPTASDAVVVTFNADQGNMGLKDYTGDVYAHTGVITDKSTSGSDWKFVIAPWETNLPKAKMTRVSSNVYTLSISPSIRDFYGVPTSDTIKKLAFVFRSSDRTKEGKSATGGDIFYDVQKTPVFEIMLTQPDKYTSLVNAGETVTIEASVSMGDSLILFQNNVRLKKVTTLTTTHNLTATGTGLFKVVARAYYNLGIKEDSVFYYIKPTVIVEDVPAGLDPGVNITGDNSATFVLYAPGKDNVFVLGDFNNWLFCDDGFMKKSADGKWWLAVTDIDPAKEYGFQYVIDGTIRIPDPYTTKVLDPWNDKYITSATYPGLQTYPEGLAEGLVAVFRTRPPEYVWENTSFATPSKEDLVIYELLVRDFVAAHDFKTIRDSLAYFSRLGVNAIEFMPVTEFDGNSSWGYNPTMYFAIDKYYGPGDSFKELVDSCHSRGIAVIMDLVLNHTNNINPLVKMYFNSADNKPAADNPWYNVNTPHFYSFGGSDFNHESIAAQAFVDSICHYWISEFKVDGFRFDFTKGFTNKASDSNVTVSAYDASRIAILNRLGEKIWSYKPDAALILEHFADNNEEKDLANNGFMLWGNAKNDYLEAAMGYSSDLSKASYLNLGWSQPGLVTYMESHDEERMMFKNISYGATSVPPAPGYDVKEFNTAIRRVKLAATFFFTIPGPKMIWQFEEVGYDIPRGEGDEKLAEKPIRWDYYTDTDRRNVYDNFKALIDLRKNYETFSSNDFTIYQTGKLKRLNVVHSEMDVVAVGNFDVASGGIYGNFTRTGKWYEFFSGDSVEINTSNQNMALNLLPGEYRLYTSKKIARPSFLLSIDDNVSGGISGELLFEVYPNPFSEETRIKFTGENEYQPHTVEIFSADGARVRIISCPAGISEVPLDGADFAGGIYYVRVTSGRLHSVMKIIRL